MSQPPLDETCLKVDDLSIAFGGVQALAGVSLDVRRREIFSVIGPNGAGKLSRIANDFVNARSWLKVCGPYNQGCAPNTPGVASAQR